jgi:hypothetical protein
MRRAAADTFLLAARVRVRCRRRRVTVLHPPAAPARCRSLFLRMTCAAAPPLEALRSRFHAQGYLVLEHWLHPDELAALRHECDAVVASAAAASSACASAQRRQQRRGGGEAWVARERGCVFEVPGACGVEHACDAAAFKARALQPTERHERSACVCVCLC